MPKSRTHISTRSHHWQIFGFSEHIINTLSDQWTILNPLKCIWSYIVINMTCTWPFRWRPLCDTPCKWPDLVVFVCHLTLYDLSVILTLYDLFLTHIFVFIYCLLPATLCVDMSSLKHTTYLNMFGLPRIIIIMKMIWVQDHLEFSWFWKFSLLMGLACSRFWL